MVISPARDGRVRVQRQPMKPSCRNRYEIAQTRRAIDLVQGITTPSLNRPVRPQRTAVLPPAGDGYAIGGQIARNNGLTVIIEIDRARHKFPRPPRHHMPGPTAV